MIITEPGIYDLTDVEYHADKNVPGGSLSSSGARTILKSPALYQWQQTHRVEKTTYDVGHAAHAKILGVGMGVIAYPAEHLTPSGNASTKGATTVWATEQRAAGLVPVTPGQIAEVDAMAEAVLAHPLARPLLERPGQSEASLFHPDPETGVWLRARIDRLPDQGPGRTVAVDLKTGRSADPTEFNRSAADYGYDVQAEWYKAVLRQVRGDEDPAFVFIVVESAPPYLVSVIELTGAFPQIGRDRMRRAIDTFQRCRETGEWPGYDPVVHYVEPPRYYEIQNEETAA